MAADDEGPRRPSLRRAGRALLSRARARLRREAAPLPPAQVTFEGHPPRPVEAGVTLLQAARTAGVDLSHYCGGTCSCGTCRVEIVAGAEHLTEPQGREAMVLGDTHTRRGDRLACQARVHGPVVVRVPEWF